MGGEEAELRPGERVAGMVEGPLQHQLVGDSQLGGEGDHGTTLAAVADEPDRGRLVDERHGSHQVEVGLLRTHPGDHHPGRWLVADVGPDLREVEAVLDDRHLRRGRIPPARTVSSATSREFASTQEAHRSESAWSHHRGRMRNGSASHNVRRAAMRRGTRCTQAMGRASIPGQWA